MLLLSSMPVSVGALGASNKIGFNHLHEDGIEFPLSDKYNPRWDLVDYYKYGDSECYYYFDCPNITFKFDTNDSIKFSLLLYEDLAYNESFFKTFRAKFNVGGTNTVYVDFESNYKDITEYGGYGIYHFVITNETIMSLCLEQGVISVSLVAIQFTLNGDYIGQLFDPDAKITLKTQVADFSYGYVNDFVVDEEDLVNDALDSSDKAWYSGIVEFFAKITTTAMSWLITGFSALASLIGEVLTPVISSLGDVLQNCFDIFKPYLADLFNNSILPAVNNILGVLNNIVTAIVEAFAPYLADIVNFFSPYFNQLGTIITNSFADLVQAINPMLQDFITAINPSLDGIVSTLTQNIETLVSALFVPTEVSETDFEEFKNQLNAKIPIFSQLKSFLVVLFNPETYTDCKQYTLEIVELVPEHYEDFEDIYWEVDDAEKVYTFKTSSGVEIWELLEVGKKYTLSFDYTESALYFNSVNLSLHFYYFDNGNLFKMNFVESKSFSRSFTCNQLTIDNHLPYITFSGPRDAFDSSNLKNIKLLVPETVTSGGTLSAVSSDFIVDIYGKKVSVLDMSWYLPFKQYGDICVIAFCYLAFIWRLFKKLPSMV